MEFEKYIVMFPTRKSSIASRDLLLCIQGYVEYDDRVKKIMNKGDLCMGVSRYAIDKNWQRQHLYVVSKESIEIGDWIAVFGGEENDNDPIKKPQLICRYTGSELGIMKIIGTSDESLDLPLISNDFLTRYCEASDYLRNKVLIKYKSDLFSLDLTNNFISVELSSEKFYSKKEIGDIIYDFVNHDRHEVVMNGGNYNKLQVIKEFLKTI